MLGLPLLHAGKVRELYALPERDDVMLMVATDNISAFDWVLASRIPDKGAILNQLSLWWFDRLGGLVDNHVRSLDVPEPVRGRAVICQRLEMIPVECVARGYLTGSGWVEYQRDRSVCGVPLPEGLSDGARLPEPIFTPATKAQLGDHDENVDFATVVDQVGRETAEEIRRLTLQVYAAAEQLARERGIILADTKFEFGRRADGTIVLADEVLTPDSSRFWEAATWPGSLDSFDKQFVRNWLLDQPDWDRNGEQPPPPLPEEVVAATRQRYAEAYQRLTGSEFRP
ncbi:phosphoribosylaminoimidazolesuccinocarboxamide synthase [Enemella dayhoffiae]|uniref:Phosphoribosylaminoimidazole-succinocarboxamide synthase n=1 Tax=Enemella dayhoffiae TaxID=2016507 RepID=A0A255H747_9ACTN|nr:phosphoribosylaminoimidazolesuccinocarboxamide synthase [Enemella dayhoffiae]